MPQVEVKALSLITDGGHYVEAGQTASVPLPYANEWIARGWAELAPEKPKSRK